MSIVVVGDRAWFGWAFGRFPSSPRLAGRCRISSVAVYGTARQRVLMHDMNLVALMCHVEHWILSIVRYSYPQCFVPASVVPGEVTSIRRLCEHNFIDPNRVA